MAPRFSASGSFAGVYGVSETYGGGAIDETANYSGAVMVFQQTAAPTGWTKETTDNDAILTVTTGSLSTGGISNFSTLFNDTVSVTGAVTFGSITVGSTTITNTMILPHGHSYVGYTTLAGRLGPSVAKKPSAGSPIGPGAYPPTVTSGTSHNHPNPASGLNSGPATYFSTNFNLKYVDIIIATKS